MDLIRHLDNMSEMERFRISSIEPNLLTDEIIEFVAQSKRFMPHFHIPLQSGSNDVLKLMRRRYTRELFAEKVAKIHALIPNAFIGVDVIAGMRGETDAFFADSLRFIESLDISQLHVFPYSERQGTKALDIPLIVSQQEKHNRVNAIIELSNQKLNAFYQRFVGTTHTVLFEDNNYEGKMCGFTDNYIKVEIPFDANQVNKITEIELTTSNLKLETL